MMQKREHLHGVANIAKVYRPYPESKLGHPFKIKFDLSGT